MFVCTSFFFVCTIHPNLDFVNMQNKTNKDINKSDYNTHPNKSPSHTHFNSERLLNTHTLINTHTHTHTHTQTTLPSHTHISTHNPYPPHTHTHTHTHTCDISVAINPLYSPPLPIFSMSFKKSWRSWTSLWTEYEGRNYIYYYLRINPRTLSICGSYWNQWLFEMKSPTIRAAKSWWFTSLKGTHFNNTAKLQCKWVNPIDP